MSEIERANKGKQPKVSLSVNGERSYTADNIATRLSSTNFSSNDLFAADYKEQSYWHDQSTDALPLIKTLPKSVDVAVIGSGYTGLHTAIQTSRGGRSTLVLEAYEPGHGCSTRNGGQISTSIKPSIEQLSKKYGLDKAVAIRQEGEIALEWIEEFVQTESIECDFMRKGRFHAAHSSAQFKLIASHANQLSKKEGIEAFVVPKSEQRSELGTDVYHGGVVFPRHASLHAGKYHRGLLNTATHSGAEIIAHCPVIEINRIAESGDAQFAVKTSQGVVHARNVMVATNGYTSNLTPWLHRRIVPIGSYIIATENLNETLINELFPTDRIASDTCRVVYYYRASPDRTRVLFGGRVSANETNPRISGPRLHKQMCRIFPQLQNTKISHSWAGTVGYTFDTLAHTGVHEGLHYAMGYCGSGVSMASYLGMRCGQKILEDAAGITALDNLPFPGRPLYKGKPWFLPPVVSWYQWRDKQEYKKTT